MPDLQKLALGALGLLLLTWLTFKGVSVLIATNDAVFEEPVPEGALTAAVEVQLLGPDGAPPEECVATLWMVADGKKRTTPELSGHYPGGALSWSGVAPGTYRLQASVPGAERFMRNLELKAGDSVDLGEVKLGPGGILEVKVVAPDGRPLPGASVWLGNWLATTTNEGIYRFVGAPAGDLQLRAQFDNVTEVMRYKLPAGGVEAMELKLEDLVIRGVIGVGIEPGDKGIRVTAVAANGPAHGLLQQGDMILAADGLPSLGLTRQAAESQLDGAPGEVLTLRVARDGVEHTVEVKRADLLDVLIQERGGELPGAAEKETGPEEAPSVEQ
jgi:hypothetical protein